MRKLRTILMLLVLASAGFVGMLNPRIVAAADHQGASKHNLTVVSGPSAGEVTLSWKDVATADNYHVVYGTSREKMQYGALNIGTSKKYVVKGLVPGATYYFALVPVFNNTALYTTYSTAGVAMGGKVAVAPVKKITAAPSTAVYQPVTGGVVGKHNLRAMSGPRIGEVTLRWNDAEAVDNYHVVYGTTASKMQYGALNIGKDGKYTIKGLIPGVKYYFALVPVFDNRALYTTRTVAAYAKAREMEIVPSTLEAVRQPVVKTQKLPVKQLNPIGSESKPIEATSAPQSIEPTTPAGY